MTKSAVHSWDARRTEQELPEEIDLQVEPANVPRSQTPFGNAIAEAIPLPIPIRERYGQQQSCADNPVPK